MDWVLRRVVCQPSRQNKIGQDGCQIDLILGGGSVRCKVEPSISSKIDLSKGLCMCLTRSHMYVRKMAAVLIINYNAHGLFSILNLYIRISKAWPSKRSGRTCLLIA